MEVHVEGGVLGSPSGLMEWVGRSFVVILDLR
jgi:hypothetical protein